MKLRIATRRSPLALVQTRWVATELRAHNSSLEIEEVPIVTQGDRILDTPLMRLGGKGLFVSELEQALHERRADIAVHSMKDVPAALAPGLAIVCIPRRADPRDVLVMRTATNLAELPSGASVGTSSLRRVCQLRALRPDLAFMSVRGNVDTRIRKLQAGEVDAVVLAAAGLNRLGLTIDGTCVLSIGMCLPAIGQGALAIESRDDDDAARAAVAALNDEETSLAIEAERSLLVELQGNCHAPLAAFARRVDAGRALLLDALVGSHDTTTIIRASGRVDVESLAEDARAIAAALGRDVAADLLRRGAKALIDAADAFARDGTPSS
jgi:hydroxymethylbilane synthase